MSIRHQAIFLLLILSLFSSVVIAQQRTFTGERIEYALELPSPAWRVVSRLDVHDHADFVYGEMTDGYLHVSKNVVGAGTTVEDLISRDEAQRLQLLPGYVKCKEAPFTGNLSGRILFYEYTSGGQQMSGRIYYLQVDNRTIYKLHFTVASDKLQPVEDQVEMIARSFRIK